MSRITELNKTIRHIAEYSKTLPPGIGILTADDLPIYPIHDDIHGGVSHWCIHLQKEGSGPRPDWSEAHFQDGIAEFPGGWKLVRLRIDDFHIQFSESVVSKIKEKVDVLNVRDKTKEN